jgi:hypothetical protein
MLDLPDMSHSFAFAPAFFCLFEYQMFSNLSRISVITMTGAAIAIDDASSEDTIISVKQRVFAANRKLYVRRQRLVYTAGPRGMDALADDETLGGAGVARDGSAELDVLLADLTPAEVAKLDGQVCFISDMFMCDILFKKFSNFLSCALNVFYRRRIHRLSRMNDSRY